MTFQDKKVTFHLERPKFLESYNHQYHVVTIEVLSSINTKYDFKKSRLDHNLVAVKMSPLVVLMIFLILIH